jgi:hypothetical protein
MEIIDITEEVFEEPEMRMYEKDGWLVVIKARATDASRHLGNGDKFKFKGNSYVIKQLEFVHATPDDYLDIGCLRTRDAE